MYCVGFNYRDDLSVKRDYIEKNGRININSENFDNKILVGVEFKSKT